MADFQYKFFPTVYDVEVRGIGGISTDGPVQAAYCKYNNQLLQLVVSSLYISALFSGIVASRFARALGRKVGLFDSFIILVVQTQLALALVHTSCAACLMHIYILPVLHNLM